MGNDRSTEQLCNNVSINYRGKAITMQGFTLTPITAAEKYTLVLESTQLDINFYKVDGP